MLTGNFTSEHLLPEDPLVVLHDLSNQDAFLRLLEVWQCDGVQVWVQLLVQDDKSGQDVFVELLGGT